MILKSLKLENIRSYADQTVSFPLGTTLFEGDIGSGKSTILMAVEFALFGLGSEKGGALLKAGEKQGSVILRFEVEGKDYEVYRRLERRAKSVQQSEGTLKIDDQIMNLSASELKEKVLEVLAFNEPPDPKAQSVIYRYAIFTPQEEMKAIIWMRPDARLQTLRRAFRIEDYRTAMDNSSLLAKWVNDKAIKLASHSRDIEARREKCQAVKMEIKKCDEELDYIQTGKQTLEETIVKLRQKADALQKSKDALGKALGEVPLLEKQIEDKSHDISKLEAEIQDLNSDAEKIRPEREKLSNFQKPTANTQAQLKQELKTVREEQRRLRAVHDVIGSKISDYESVGQKKICPTCDRPADPLDFEDKIKLKREEQNRASENVAACEKKIEETERLLDSLCQYELYQETLTSLNERLRRDENDVEKDRQKINSLCDQISNAKEKLANAKQQVGDFKNISREVEETAKELDGAASQLTKVEKRISALEATKSELSHQVGELDEEILSKEKEKKAADRLKEYQIWLEEFLTPTLQAIEKYVMMNINQEFNQHFQKWWGMLVEDPSKESRIDEDFTPMIEQDGYEQDFNYLSGGEKTSLALAYRLALNTIVQKVSAGVRSNLLILDEPTDGFSKEQLFKIREILDELKCPQVVIVSHEKELESFADQVMRIEKKDGISEIKAA